MKKVMSIFLCAIMLLLNTGGTNSFAFSSHELDDTTISPYALACDCGGSFSKQTTTYTPWGFVKYDTCPDNSYYTCKKYTRTKTTTYGCNSCTKTYSNKSTEVKWGHTH